MKRITYLLGIGIISLTLLSCGEEASTGEEYNQPESTDNTTSETETSESTKETGGRTKLASPRKDTVAMTNAGQIHVDWGSPSVKGRTIWGELVPYDEVWRAGANETTNLTFSDAVIIGESIVEPGTYGFFIIPRENQPWIAVFNKLWNKEKHGIWGSYGYDKTHDVARVEIAPEALEANQEMLEYVLEENGVALIWEKQKVFIPIVKA